MSLLIAFLEGTPLKLHAYHIFRRHTTQLTRCVRRCHLITTDNIALAFTTKGNMILTYVNEGGAVAGPQVVEDASFTQVGQVGHVHALLVFGWVHVSKIINLKCFGL